MREIKFRGMTELGEWKCGLLTFMFGQYAIVDPIDENSVYLIDKETVGQYTGLKDKNGTEICEGDIIKGWRYGIYTVAFVEKRGGYYPFAQGDGCGCCNDEVESDATECEVIGNQFENPELIEEAEA